MGWVIATFQARSLPSTVPSLRSIAAPMAAELMLPVRLAPSSASSRVAGCAPIGVLMVTFQVPVALIGALASARRGLTEVADHAMFGPTARDRGAASVSYPGAIVRSTVERPRSRPSTDVAHATFDSWRCAVLAAVRSATLVGVDGQSVIVEVHVSQGLPSYSVVGLPDTAVRESRERVRAALLSSGLAWPQQRVTVNLAPGGLRKSGSGLELAIALGVLAAGDELPAGALDGVAVLGELGLDGSVRAVPGTLALVDALQRAGATTVIVPCANAAEAELVRHVHVRAARTLGELRACVKGEGDWPDWSPAEVDERDAHDDEPLDLHDVRGLQFARRAL